MAKQPTKIVYLNRTQIRVVPGRNTRFDHGDLELLAKSIANSGVQKPLEVQTNNDQYELVDGHRRLAAIEIVEVKFEQSVRIPAILIDAEIKDKEIDLRMLIANEGKPFLPLEEAQILKRLQEQHKLKVEEIAKLTGKSLSHVSNTLSLLSADESVQQALKDKKINKTDAITTIRKSRGDKEKQKQVIQRVETEGNKDVINKELKKGRLQKGQWDEAEAIYEDVWSALATHQKLDQIQSVIKAKDPLKNFQDNAELEVAFTVGMLYGVARLANLSLQEMWDKLDQRVGSK